MVDQRQDIQAGCKGRAKRPRHYGFGEAADLRGRVEDDRMTLKPATRHSADFDPAPCFQPVRISGHSVHRLGQDILNGREAGRVPDADIRGGHGPDLDVALGVSGRLVGVH